MRPEARQETRTQTLARYGCTLRYDDIPADVVAHAKRVLVNIASATLWGWRTTGGRQVHEVMRGLGGPLEATVFGTNDRLPAPAAASIHAALAFATMSDDTHGPAQIHSGHATVPAALADAERLGASGKDVIAAIVAANEVGIRIAHSVGPEQDQIHNSMRMGFWAELKAGFCSLVASGRLLGLTPEQMAHGIGIAATSSSGLLATGYALPADSTQCGTIFSWDAAKAVWTGALAARLAKAGMTSGPAPLEGPRGWIETYTGGHGRPESLTEKLGEVFETRRIALKTHCMSHTVFPLVDAAYRLATRHALAPDDIERVTVVGAANVGRMLWRTRVISFEDAMCSAPFPIALNLLAPSEMTLPDKVIGHIGNPAIDALLARFDFVLDPAIPVNAGPLPGTLRLSMRDGRVYEERADARIKGLYPEFPLSDAEIESKLVCAAEGILSSERVRRFLELAAKLEREPTILEVVACLRPDPQT